ncbi:hypothetical protein PNA2_1319 [Pyrococcus sp. NA2]|uniref:hypothetical protein n=1 Tax=Pyrococcus sp. (strain NA2) TaxID=342949 RepID=UPI000209AD77|nr:hypothetical protein [Pyrococcus sp. NA2]AEC52234.1 hypothetical protein PNA2_1319 [Pyrococcus sp. NA2]
MRSRKFYINTLIIVAVNIATLILFIYLLKISLSNRFQIASAIATVILAVIALLQAALNAENLEYQRSLIMFPVMREHTKKLQEEVIRPLLSFFKSIGVNDDGNVEIFLRDLSLPMSGFETLKDVLKILIDHFDFRPYNKDLFYDLIENHIPILEQLWEEFTGVIISLNNSMLTDKQRQELIESFKNLREYIINILSKATTVEVFLDECNFVRGTTKEDWTVNVLYKSRMSLIDYILWRLRIKRK